jgi:hypothetical protein
VEDYKYSPTLPGVALALPAFGNSRILKRGEELNMVEIPKTIIIERIHSRSGPEAADSANDELPDKLDLDSDSDARLLRRSDIDPNELREEFGGGSPSAG